MHTTGLLFKTLVCCNGALFVQNPAMDSQNTSPSPPCPPCPPCPSNSSWIQPVYYFGLFSVVGVVLILFMIFIYILTESKKRFKPFQAESKEKDDEPKGDQGKTLLMEINTELEDMRGLIQRGLDEVKKENVEKKKVEIETEGKLTLDERQNLLDDQKKWEQMEETFDELKLKTDQLLSNSGLSSLKKQGEDF